MSALHHSVAFLLFFLFLIFPFFNLPEALVHLLGLCPSDRECFLPTPSPSVFGAMGWGPGLHLS